MTIYARSSDRRAVGALSSHGHIAAERNKWSGQLTFGLPLNNTFIATAARKVSPLNAVGMICTEARLSVQMRV